MDPKKSKVTKNIAGSNPSKTPVEQARENLQQFGDTVKQKFKEYYHLTDEKTPVGEWLEKVATDEEYRSKVIYAFGTAIKLGAKIVKGLASFNHPEWRENGSPIVNGANISPVGLNFAVNRTDPVPEVKEGFNYGTSPSLFMSFRTLLGTFSPEDKESMVPNAMNQYWMTLSSNSGRVPSYTSVKLLKYIHTYRSTVALLSYVTRAWMLSYQIDSYDRSMPREMLIDMGFNPDDMRREASNLRDFLKMAWMTLGSYPIVCDAVHQALWMFSNIFADYAGPKPSYIYHNLCSPVFFRPSEDAVIFDGTYLTSRGTNRGTTSVKDIMNDISNALLYTREFVENDQLQADMIRVNGLSFAEQIAQTAINVLNTAVPAMTYTVDPYMQKQLKNARTLGFTHLSGTTVGQSDLEIKVETNGAIGYQSNYAIAQTDVNFASNRSDFNRIMDAHVIDATGVNMGRLGESLSCTSLSINTSLFDDPDKSGANMRVDAYESAVIYTARVTSFVKQKGSLFDQELEAQAYPMTSYAFIPLSAPMGGTTARNYINGLSAIAQIDEHLPILPICYTGTIATYQYNWNFAEYAVAYDYNMASRHRLGAFSLWAAKTSPQFVKSSQNTHTVNKRGKGNNKKK